MLCINPFRPRKGVEYGCGQCRVCRVNRSRMWTGRLLLESVCHPVSTFATFTYSPEHQPLEGLSNLHWRELSWQIGFRYFGVGEYGDRFGRPHYHMVLFGLDPLAGMPYLQSRWPYGFVHAVPFSGPLAAYLARYTTKKYLQPRSFDGNPEFQRMSRRPAIGAPALGAVFDWMTSSAGAAFVARNGDVPSVMKSSGKVYPLGRTLVLKLREAAGLGTSIPETCEERRQVRALLLEDPDFRARLENRRVATYERVSASIVRRGVH